MCCKESSMHHFMLSALNLGMTCIYSKNRYKSSAGPMVQPREDPAVSLSGFWRILSLPYWKCGNLAGEITQRALSWRGHMERESIGQGRMRVREEGRGES